MTRASEVYSERGPSGIPIAFDCGEPEQEALFESFREAFGEAFTRSEDLGALERRCLTILPGGARGAQR